MTLRFARKLAPLSLLLALLQIMPPARAADPPFRVAKFFGWTSDDVGKKPPTGKDQAIEQLAKNLDWLEHQVNLFGTVVAKAPDVWGEARLTAHRQEFEDVLKQELRNFDKKQINGAEFVSDQSFLAFALAMQGKTTGTDSAGKTIITPPSITTNVNSTSTAEGGKTTTTGGATPSIVLNVDAGKALQPFGITPDKLSIGSAVMLEQTEMLDQLARYINHLHQIRRINEGDDISDSPGYAMNLVRVPVSLLPGQHTKRGYGAEITFTAEAYHGPELLPMAFRDFVVNDLIDQLSMPLARFLNGDPKAVDELMKKFEIDLAAAAAESQAKTGATPSPSKDSDRQKQFRFMNESVRKSFDKSNLVSNLKQTLKSIHIPATTTRRATLPFPPTQLFENFGFLEIAHVAYSAHSAFQVDLFNREVIHISDLQSFLREEVSAAYELICDESMKHWWGNAAVGTGSISQMIRTRKHVALEQERDRFMLEISPRTSDMATAALAWCLYVDSLLLNERLVHDIKETLGNRPNTVIPSGWLPYFGPNPPDEARQAFNEYVKVRWPIHVFALDPVNNEQNIADVRSIYRQMQMAIALSFANGDVGTSAALQTMRKLQRDRATVDLNRTAVGFGHGDDTFGWRFIPRFQTPPVESNVKVLFRDLIVGGPTDKQLERSPEIEPGIRECTAIVVMPSFVPHVTFTTRGNWFKLGSPSSTANSITDTVQYSRAIKQMQTCAQECIQCAHLYRDGEVDRLMKRVHQLDRRLPLQTLECQVPIENSHGGFEVFSTGTRELAPELNGWYGAPGYDVTRGCRLFLSGDNFNVTTTRLIVGNQEIPVRLLSRQIMEVTLPAGLAVMRDRNLDVAERELYEGYVDAHVATPYGVSGHLLIPVVRGDRRNQGKVVLRPNIIKLIANYTTTAATATAPQTSTVQDFTPPNLANFLRIDVPTDVGLTKPTQNIRLVTWSNEDRLVNVNIDNVVRTSDGRGFELTADQSKTQLTTASGLTTLSGAIKDHLDYLFKINNGVAPTAIVRYKTTVAIADGAAASATNFVPAEGELVFELILTKRNAP